MGHRLLAITLAAAITAACDSRPGTIVGVQPPASRIAFLTQPNNVQVGVAISPAVQVAVQTSNGQTVTTSSAEITLTIVPGTGTAGAVLTGGATQAATNGVVLFNNLRIDLAGTGYQLLATTSGFPAVASVAFNVTP